MSIQDEFLAADRNIGAELNDSVQKVVDALQGGNVPQSKVALGEYFSLIRYADAFGLLSEEDRDYHIHEWSNGMVALSGASPSHAFFAAYDAVQVCSRNENGLLPCNTIIANTVFVHINVNVMRAVYHHIHQGYSRPVMVGERELISNEPYQMAQAKVYLIPVMQVITAASQFEKSSNLEDTFFEALTQFENLIHSVAVAPTTAFEVVQELKMWADKNDKQGSLAFRMHELIEEASYLPNGKGMLLNEWEADAEVLGEESREWFAKKPVHISAAFAVKAGLDIEFADFHERIETAFAQGKYQDVVKELSDLFSRLGEDSEDENEEYIAEDLNSYAYFFENANKLNMMSEDHGYQLAHFCVHAIESDMACVSEKVMAKVYECALPVISFVDAPDSDRAKDIKEIYKIILKRSSEFDEVDETIDIFGCAEDGYRIHLAKLSPVEIYKEIAELSAWVDEREIASPYLCNFVDSLMDCAKSYGDVMGIPPEYVIGADDDDPDPISPKFSVVDASPAP